MSDGLSSERESRRRAALVAVLVITVLLAASIVLIANLGDDPNSVPKPDATAPTIKFANSVAGYTLATDADAKERTSAFETAARKDLAFNTASVIVYTPPGAAKGSLVAVAASTHDNGRLRAKLATAKPDQIVRELLVSSDLIGGAVYPTTDGTLECGTTAQHGVSAPICAWVGRSTIGVVIDFANPSPQPDSLAVLAQAIRAGAEH
jgi:hypothetical protein